MKLLRGLFALAVAAVIFSSGCVQLPYKVADGLLNYSAVQAAPSALEKSGSVQGESAGQAAQAVSSRPSPSVQAEFSCENDAGFSSRGYVLLMGLGDHSREGWFFEQSLMEKDAKARFVLIYDQDENLGLQAISEKFLADLRGQLAKTPVDELVLFGASAGGVTASNSVARLDFSGPIALHTLSSPLKGYGFAEVWVGEGSRFYKEIATGALPRYAAPGANVKAYHHKTVTDTILKDHYCGAFASLCDVRKIQDNNLPGSKEFYYPEYDHNPLMHAVIPRVLKCYNPELDTSDAAGLPSLGDMCIGEEGCNVFCKVNFGRCRQYCASHPDNGLCQKPFSFEQQNSGGQLPTSPTPLQAAPAPSPFLRQPATQASPNYQQPPSPAPQSDSPPVLKNLGVEFGAWNREAGRAGAFLFNEAAKQREKIFLEFGARVRDSQGGTKTLPTFEYVTAGDADVFAVADGVVLDAVFQPEYGDYELTILPAGSANWRVYHDHVRELRVAKGQGLKAGEVIGKVGTSAGGLGRMEIMLGAPGSQGRPVDYCPFLYFDPQLKKEFEERVSRHMRDWEEFKGDSSIYDERNHVLPGCATESLED